MDTKEFEKTLADILVKNITISEIVKYIEEHKKEYEEYLKRSNQDEK